MLLVLILVISVGVVNAQTVEVSMGTLLEGDCNMDNTSINVFDLIIFKAAYIGAYNSQADLDNNSAVNVFVTCPQLLYHSQC